MYPFKNCLCVVTSLITRLPQANPFSVMQSVVDSRQSKGKQTGLLAPSIGEVYTHSLCFTYCKPLM